MKTEQPNHELDEDAILYSRLLLSISSTGIAFGIICFIFRNLIG